MLNTESKEHFRRFASGNWNSTLIEHIQHLKIKNLNAKALFSYLDICIALGEFQPKDYVSVVTQAHNRDLWHQPLCMKLIYLFASPEIIPDLSKSERKTLLAVLNAELNSLNYKKFITSILPGRLGTRLLHYPGLLRQQSQFFPTCKTEDILFSHLSSKAQTLDALSSTIEQTLRNLQYSIANSAVMAKRLQIAVVGNSPKLLHTASGSEIDDADIVIRFNNVKHAKHHIKHTGKKTDIWMMSPSTSIKSCPTDAKAIVVSGIHPLTKPSLYWKSLPSANKPLCDCPATVWYELVKRFNAPPSAGALLLATLQRINMNLDIRCYGFSTADRELCLHENHFADKTLRSSRHNWQAEVRWLADCISQNKGFTISCQ